MYLDLPETAEYAKMLLDNVFNAHLVEKNKEPGGCSVITPAVMALRRFQKSSL